MRKRTSLIRVPARVRAQVHTWGLAAACVALVTGFGTGAAASDYISSTRWLPPALLAQLPTPAWFALNRYYLHVQNVSLTFDQTDCERAIQSPTDVNIRPSLATLICEYTHWALAPVIDTVVADPHAYLALTQSLMDSGPDDSVLWRDALVVEAGAVLRLLGAQVSVKSAPGRHPVWRMWDVLALADKGETTKARAMSALLFEPSCRSPCSQRALYYAVLARLALDANNQGKADELLMKAESHILGRVRAVHGDKPNNDNPVNVVFVAPVVAEVLLDAKKTDRADQMLALVQTLYRVNVPDRHANVRHMHALRLVRLCDADACLDVSALAWLQRRYEGNWFAYPVTARRLAPGGDASD